MVKVRLWGELEEVNKLAEIISGLSPRVRVLSISRNYSDRGASVYNRVYMDVKLHEPPAAPEKTLPADNKAVAVRRKRNAGKLAKD